jgi:hypothetical protein
VPDRKHVDRVRFGAIEEPVGEIAERDDPNAGSLLDFGALSGNSMMRRSIGVSRASKGASIAGQCSF